MTIVQPYLPAAICNIDPEDITKGYWDACKEKRLVIQQCLECKIFRHQPTPNCPNCYSFEYIFADVSGRGTVFSYTIAHHPVHPALHDRGPYNIVTVDLDDAPVRLVSNLVGVANEDIHIGMAVEVCFEEQAPGMFVPRFKQRF